MLPDTLILRRSEWNGADNDLLAEIDAESGNQLLVDRGPGKVTMCCLGVDMHQRHGFSKEDISEAGMPSEIFQDEDMPYGEFDFSQHPSCKYFVSKLKDDTDAFDRDFESIAAGINDDRDATVEEKVERLSRLYATIGVKVEYRPDE